MPDDYIRIRGVRVHNLRDVDLDIPRNRLVAFCGVSGSGKTSLALDTLFAEGQRRYIESFSAHIRQFLARLEKPDADRIDGLPPAIAITHKDHSAASRSTIGAATEIDNHLRLLFARIGRVVCHGCGKQVRQESASTVAQQLSRLPAGTRFMVAFARTATSSEHLGEIVNELREEGFVRVIAAGKMWNLSSGESLGGDTFPAAILVVIDRLTAGDMADQRVLDSLETAFAQGDGRCVVLTSAAPGDAKPSETIDGREWLQSAYSSSLTCADCRIDYPAPDPRLYSFSSPLGACPECEGFGNLVDIDMELVVPDGSKSLADGAIAPWSTPAYRHELEELLALAPDYDLPVNIPFSELDERQVALIREGVPEREFGGLREFFAWLEKRTYKMHLRVFLSRWRSYRPCPSCGGTRLRPEALATKIGGRSISEILAAKIVDSREFFLALDLNEWERTVGRTMLEQVTARLGYLIDVGLGYLTLDRTLRTISNGEAQRVTLTSALGSSLVNMLYVLDEPSVGLHPRDVDRLIKAVVSLRERSNTVVVVEHEEAMLRAAAEPAELPALIREAGGAARFAFEEFLHGQIRNPFTRKAYLHTIRLFSDWCVARGLELVRVTPADVGRFLDSLPVALPTRKLHLAALRRLFDGLVMRHVLILNPALSVRSERYQVVEGKTPEITVEHARRLLKSIAVSHEVGRRDFAEASLGCGASHRSWPRPSPC